MLEFILFVVLFIILVPSLWLIVYRRAISVGAGMLMAHVRGLVFSAAAFVVLSIVIAVVMDDFSKPRRSEDRAGANAVAPASNTAATVNEGTSDASYAKFARMYQDRHLDDLEAELVKGHVAALKIIPALGGKSNVAEVLKSRGILIGRNADINCWPMVKLANAPGCILTVYLSRKTPVQQTDLSGVAAHWFMGVDETRFRPLDGWAQHVDQNDQWLNASAMLGYADNR